MSTARRTHIERVLEAVLVPRGFDVRVVDEGGRVRRWEHRRAVDGDGELVVARLVERGAGCTLDVALGVTIDAIERRLRPLEQLCGRPLRGELWTSDTTESCGVGELYAKWPAVFADDDTLGTALAALARYLTREGLEMLSGMRDADVLYERFVARTSASASTGQTGNVALRDVYAAVLAGHAPGLVIAHRRALLDVRRTSLNAWYGARHDAWRRAFEHAVDRLEVLDGEVVARELEEREVVRSIDQLAYWSLVRHPKLGLGRVTKVTGEGDRTSVEVELLESKKTKTFLARFICPTS